MADGDDEVQQASNAVTRAYNRGWADGKEQGVGQAASKRVHAVLLRSLASATATFAEAATINSVVSRLTNMAVDLREQADRLDPPTPPVP